MSIKEQSKRASTNSQNGEDPGRRVVPESTISDFIGGLGTPDVDRLRRCDRQHLQLGLVNHPEVNRTLNLEDIRGLGRPS